MYASHYLGLSLILNRCRKDTKRKPAIAHNDLEMMTVVTKTDLKKIQKHEKCYLDYTRVVRKTAESTEGGNDRGTTAQYFLW